MSSQIIHYGPKNLKVSCLVVNPSKNWGKHQWTVLANAFKLDKIIYANFEDKWI